jgi:hypothetical protein
MVAGGVRLGFTMSSPLEAMAAEEERMAAEEDEGEDEGEEEGDAGLWDGEDPFS